MSFLKIVSEIRAFTLFWRSAMHGQESCTIKNWRGITTYIVWFSSQEEEHLIKAKVLKEYTDPISKCQQLAPSLSLSLSLTHTHTHSLCVPVCLCKVPCFSLSNRKSNLTMDIINWFHFVTCGSSQTQSFRSCVDQQINENEKFWNLSQQVKSLQCHAPQLPKNSHPQKHKKWTNTLPNK